MQFESRLGEETFEVTINDELTEASVNGRSLPLEIVQKKPGRMLLRSGTKLYTIDNITIDGQSVSFSLNGRYVETTVKDEQELLLEKLGFTSNAAGSAGVLLAPMPGKILELMVAEGDEVEEGDPVIILEAMKMENELKSPASGTVVKVDIQANDNVEKNQSLLEIEPRG
jgi:biotin carboxyl carrier protein